MNHLVTVVITTYKRRVSQIQKAIMSVLNQSYSDLELIIVDDSPNNYEYRDEVEKYCTSIEDRRVRYIQHKTNQGACVARNTGLKYASGEYISFLDDDDEYLKERLIELVSLFDYQTCLVYSNSNIIKILSKDKKVNTAFESGRQYSGKIHDKILGENFIGSTSVVMMRTEILRKIGGFDPNLEASQDWDVWIRISKFGDVKFTNKILVNYYIYQGERITNDTDRRLRALLYLNEKNKNELIKNNDAKLLRKIFEMRLRAIANDYVGTFDCYYQIVKMRPWSIVKNIICAKSFARFLIKKINA